MRAKALLAGLLPLSVAAVAVAGCGGLGGQLTDAVCQCEHCDDWREDKLIALHDTTRAIATTYGCEAEWESLVQCEIDEGTCDEEKARWSVSEPGKCNASMNLMVTCVTDLDCAALQGATCSAATKTCTQKICSGGGPTCDSDSDCTAGEYLCLDELQELVECEDDAADDKSYIGFGAADN
jgi:hypothetical protein